MARTRAIDYEQKRLGILSQSARLFAQHGFTGTSITMIAEACGVSKALMYHYYDSKDDVLFDVLADHLKHLVATVEAAATERDARRRLIAISTALLDAYRGADAEHQVQISSLKLLPSAQQDVLKELERRLVTIFSEAIAASLAPAAARPDILKPLTMSLFGMLNWHYLWFRDGKGMTRDAYARMAANLILAGAEDAIRAADTPEATAASAKSAIAKKKAAKARS
ncbi:MAG: TetR/AcrR family transcriptional regulator [Xanthobacteraceae bacterium]|nr:TetR/AcrR family transcriptional regulator [Xanthobacteraceae bacterium]